MIIKIVQNFSRIVFFTIISIVFSVTFLMAADNNLSSNPKKKSSKYIDPKVLEIQKEEEEKNNKKLREKNEIDVLYSEEYRRQNSNEFDLFEEEILRSEINDTGVFLDLDSSFSLPKKDQKTRIKVIQEGVISDYNKDIDGKNKNILNFKNPIFFVSEGIDTFSYTNTMDLCSLINLGSENIDCLVYPESNLANIPSVIRRGQNSDLYEKVGVNADFIVVRDDVYSQYKKGRGAIALAPELDTMMYLNGDYMFMFVNSMSNIFSYEHLSAIKKDKTIRVGYINQQSRFIFERTLAKVFPRHSYRYVFVNMNSIESARKTVCEPTNIDVFIYFGGVIPDNLEKAMEECSYVINPLTLSDSTLSEIIALTDFFSVANVVGYYPVSSVLNYLEIYIALESAYKRSLEKNTSSKEVKININDYSSNSLSEKNVNDSKVMDSKVTARDKERIARENKSEMLKKQRAEERTKKINELKKKREEKKLKEAEILARKMNKNKLQQDESSSGSPLSSFFSFLNFSSKSNVVEKKKQEAVYLNKELIIKEDTLNRIKGKSNNNTLLGSDVYATENEKKISSDNFWEKPYITVNTAVKTFGIRYVLLASRYAKRENVINVFDSIIKDFFLVRENIMTPDISKFNVSDIVLGTSNNLDSSYYHPALSKYPNYLLELKTRKTPEQTLALKILNVNSNSVLYPSYSGPEALTPERMDVLYTKARELNKKKGELATIRVFQRDTMNIDKALSDIRKGEQSPDSILKATGLDYVNVIVDEQSVLEQGLSTEVRLTPEAMRELEKLVDPKDLPVTSVSAEDVKKSVEESEGKNTTKGQENNTATPTVNDTTVGKASK